MALSLQQVLGYVTLTGAVKATTSGIPQPLPEAFFKATKNVIGNKGRYTRVTGERRTAPFNTYGSPAGKMDLRDVGEVDIKLLHIFGNQTLSPLVLKQLRSKNEYELDMGLDEVKRQVFENKKRFQNSRIATTLQTLHKGTLYFDKNFNLLPSSAGAFETVTFNMNANNQNQLNGVIANTWVSNATDIPGQLRNLRKRAARLTGFPLKYAFYGENIPSYLVTNNFVLDYLARNPTMQAKYLDTASIPDGLFGFTWIPVYEAFYEDQNGVNQDLWGPDDITFTPEVDENWWEFLEGSFEVPTSIGNVYADGEAAMRSTATVYGQGGYGVVTHNPPTVESYFFDTYIGAIRVPDAVYQGVVAFAPLVAAAMGIFSALGSMF